jgi:hypothetical protein
VRQQLDYEGVDSKALASQRGRARSAMWLAAAGYGVVALHFLLATTVAHLWGLPGAVLGVAYAVAVVTEYALGIAGAIKAASALRPKGPPADTAQFALVLAVLLLFLATTCGGLALMGDIS